MKSKTIFVISEDWYYWSHRRPIARGFIEKDVHVLLAAQNGHLRKEIEAEGVQLIHTPLKRGSLNLFDDIFYLFRLIKLYRREKPNSVYHVAFKPILYGSLAAFLTRVPRCVNAFAGLGYLYASETFKVRFIRNMVMGFLKLIGSHKKFHYILQNKWDFQKIKSTLNLKEDQLSLIRGAGIDVELFTYNKNEKNEIPIITHVSRLLKEKGIYELVEASKQLKDRGFKFKIWVVGKLDIDNPHSIQEEEIKGWESEGLIEWLGYRTDIDQIYQQSDIAVLATYYGEGLPKSLLEACACGLPIVTTDHPGCLEVVEHENNGLIVPMKDSKAVAKALEKLLEDKDLRNKMAEQGRKRAETEFAEDIIVEQTLNCFNLIPELV